MRFNKKTITFYFNVAKDTTTHDLMLKLRKVFPSAHGIAAM